MGAERGAPADDVVLRSRDVARLTGTTPRALRHYHQLGLLPQAPRDPNGYRRYGGQDVVTVVRIRQLAASGMPLRRIRTVLEQDDRDRDRALDELDQELAAEAARVAAQRQVLAELRGRTLQPSRFGAAEEGSATQRLDQDSWTLVTAAGAVDADTVESLVQALGSRSLAEHAASWYPAFEQLEGRADIDDATADRLARLMADFAASVMEVTGIRASAEQPASMALVEQLQAATLSGAQQVVWARCAALIDDRAPGPSEASSRGEAVRRHRITGGGPGLPGRGT